MREAPYCICATLPDEAVVPMGGDGLDERFLATVHAISSHGGEQWWLHLGRCTACGQDWLVAQEERIYDDHFLKRLARDQACAIVDQQEWPADFLTYEAVLRFGRARSKPCRFFDPHADSLVWTVADLRKSRPNISAVDIAELLGLSDEHARMLMAPS